MSFEPGDLVTTRLNRVDSIGEFYYCLKVVAPDHYAPMKIRALLHLSLLVIGKPIDMTDAFGLFPGIKDGLNLIPCLFATKKGNFYTFLIDETCLSNVV
jgi:hypothetical protein